VNGVILEGELHDAKGDSIVVHIFLTIDRDNDDVHARRSYGDRATVLTLDLADVEAALTILKIEQSREREPASLEDG
jgi:hypothetical protein